MYDLRSYYSCFPFSRRLVAFAARFSFRVFVGAVLSDFGLPLFSFDMFSLVYFKSGCKGDIIQTLKYYILNARCYIVHRLVGSICKGMLRLLQGRVICQLQGYFLISTLDGGGDHFKPFIGFESVSGMCGNDNGLASVDMIYVISNSDLGVSLDHLNIYIKRSSLFTPTCAHVKSHSIYLSGTFL